MKPALAILVLTLLIATPASAAIQQKSGNLVITPKMLVFRYIPLERLGSLECEHILADPLSQDWVVRCGKEEFRVHLWVSAYEHPTAPRLSYEILYWVSALTARPSQTTGSTLWFHLNDPSELHSLDLSQQIEEGSAELNLEIQVSKGFGR